MINSIVVISCFFILCCIGQNKSINDNKIYATNEVDSLPSFPGGEEGMRQHISRNIKWVVDSDVSGKVYLSFVVNYDGTISNITIEKGLCDKCDQEAIRVVKTMPLWRPGQLNGRSVKTKVMINISFKIIG
ncbi:energy transducer TonB [Xanthocytophaga agilis]|uniref:Energy transducer TonB n=1 Tax=Xanthocytophaga agilis TaxID=3048010 RepID=A0AAE3UIB2_9BACT|nr:energy transducer TonB [Xanthocytophaga agilis]MDJ1505186.1 energy transducer TonB [Xanthocytophaga agilis]